MVQNTEKNIPLSNLWSKKFYFEWYVGSYTLLLWFPIYLHLKFDKILTIQTLIITYEPPELLNDSKYKKRVSNKVSRA